MPWRWFNVFLTHSQFKCLLEVVGVKIIQVHSHFTSKWMKCLKNIFSPLILWLNDIISWLVARPSPSESEPSVSYSEIGRCRVNIFFTSESVLPRLSDSETFLMFLINTSYEIEFKLKCEQQWLQMPSKTLRVSASMTIWKLHS